MEQLEHNEQVRQDSQGWDQGDQVSGLSNYTRVFEFSSTGNRKSLRVIFLKHGSGFCKEWNGDAEESGSQKNIYKAIIAI